MLELLADRVDRRLPRSWFQRLAKDLFAAEAIHLVDEWPVYNTNGRRLAELDLANVDLQVGVECQSWEWHGSPSAKQRDLTRKRRLRVLGWEIVDVWWSDLPHCRGGRRRPTRDLHRASPEPGGRIDKICRICHQD